MKLDPYSYIKLDRNNTVFISVIILIGIILTIFATSFVHRKNKHEDRLRFEYQINSFLRRLEARMDSYEGALVQTRAFILNSRGVNIPELRGYIQDTELFARFPGLQGLGYTMVVRPRDVLTHKQELSRAFPQYKIWPEGKREFYTSIIVLEPSDWRNRKAIGFDMYSDPVRKEAMRKALEEDRIVMSGKVVLVQEKEGERFPGFLIYLPHYKKNAKVETEEDRKKAIMGFVYSPFRAGELFKAVMADLMSGIDIEVHDDKVVGKESLLFDSSKETSFEDAPQSLREEVTLKLNGRRWVFRFSALKSFPSSSYLMKDILVFLSGLLITLLLGWFFLVTRKQMLAVSLMASEKEKLLQKEKEHVAARDDFLSIASHELKTPLTSLKLQSQVMMRAIKRNDPDALSLEKVSNLIKQIDTQTTRLTRLVDDMLDISRIRTGRLRMEMEEVYVLEIIRDAVERLKPQFLKVTGAVPVVESDENIVANWDRFRIEQVLTNLFTNAIRYGNEKPVRVKVERKNDEVLISVIDQGIGIAPENLEKIFDRFERAGMSASEVSGLGLGLFITRQIVLSHGGDIEVESTPGKGSTFIVHLPVSGKKQNT